MNRIYSTGKTPDELNQKLRENLDTFKYKTDETLTRDQKRKGNLERYPAGSVAEYDVDKQLTYFFFALSTFNSNLHAETSDTDHVIAIMKLIEYCNTRSQGNPVIIPIIGASGANTHKDENDILRYMISLIRMNRVLIKFDLYIVVREDGKDSIPITDL